MSIRRGNGNLGRTRHKPSVRRSKRPRDREIGTLRPMETKSRATLIESLDLRRVALGPWGSLVYPWWFGTTRLRFKSGRTHLTSGTALERAEGWTWRRRAVLARIRVDAKTASARRHPSSFGLDS